MSRKPQRRKRLLILVCAVLVVGLGAGGFVLVRRWKFESDARAARDAGHAAFVAGDYEKALGGLEAYLGRFGKEATADDWLKYGKARQAVPLPNHEEVWGAIQAYKSALDIDPSSAEARDALVRLYIRITRFTEALDLIERSLAAAPEDAELLRAKADTLGDLRRFPEALVVAKLLSARPDAGRQDLLRTHRLLVRTEASPSEIDAWIDSVAATRPGDPFVALLRAVAWSGRGDTEKGGRLLDEAVASQASTKDPEMVPYLVQVLDGAERFTDALKVLRTIEDTDDAELRRQILRRLWFGGLSKEIIQRAEPWTEDRKAADAEVLVLHALALLALQRQEEVTPIAEELARRTDEAGRAWSAFLGMTLRKDPESPGRTAEKLARCTAAVPGHAILLQALGDAKMALGEWDAAVRHWTAAADAAAAWASPLVRLSRAHRGLGRPAVALDLAESAYERAPNNAEAISAYLDARIDTLGALVAPERALLFNRLEAFEREVPLVTELTLPVRIELMARTGPEKAAGLLRKFLDSTTPLREESLLRLAVIAASISPPSAEPLLQRSEKEHGATPRLAVVRAVMKRRAAGPEEALAEFDAVKTRAGGQDAEWQATRAAMLESLGRPEAAAEWVKVADAHPGELRVQLAAAASSVLWSDRDAIGRVIERLRALAGESAVTWRLAKIRYMLTNPAATEADIAEVSSLAEAVTRVAPENVSARMFFAQALEKTGHADRAAEQLEAALRLDPDNALVSLELARLAQLRGDRAAARARLDAALAAKGIPPEHTERAAFLLAAQGDLGRSAELLERVTKDGRAKREGRLTLARIYAKQGRSEEALRLCEDVLDPPTLLAVELAAGLYAEAGRTADAAAVLARLEAAGIPPADAALARARHAARWESRAVAAEQFRRAADAAPERADVWTALLVHAILAGDKAELARAMDDPRSQGIEVIKHLRSIRGLCDAALADAGLRLLLRSSVEVPSSRAAATEALRLLSRDWSDVSKRADVARSVRLLAEANVGTLELQLLAADTTAMAGDLRAGTDMARKTAVAFPNSALAARQWAELLFRGARFEEALAAGRTWSDRAPAQERSADEFLGRVLLRLDRPKDAVAALEPHAAAALARPEENEVLLLVRAAALSRSGDRAPTTELLTTLASRSERWRTLPLRVGPDWMATGDECLAWLETCAAVVPADDVKSRLALAQAWGAAWQRFRTPGLLAGMKSVVTELTARPDASADAHFLAGTAAQLQGDPAAATASYAAALKVQPDHHAARNNLAMVLADGGKWEDAVKEAQTIVRAVPQSAEYLDTLAYAYRKGRKFDEAKARLSEAIRLQPLNPKWRVSLAETLAEADDVNELADALSELRRMEESGAPFSPELRKRMERLSGIR